MTQHKILVHQKTFDIAWGDMDALGHVNNVRYFDYFQEARIEWLRTLKITLLEQFGPIVLHVGCTYLKPVIYPATLVLRTSIHSLGNSSMIIDHDLYQEEILIAQGTSKIVWVDYKQQKSVSLPESIRQLFN